MPDESDHRRPAVLITGSSSGIGTACALALDGRGFCVFAGVRREADGHRLREQATERLVTVLLDVTDTDSIRAAVKRVAASVGEAGLAGLVNNAGIGVVGPVELVPVERFRRQLEVNLIGQFAVTQAFLPMLRAARGRIVNMGSIAGRLAAPYIGPYTVSKHGLEALTDSLRLELRNWGVSVSIVDPDYVRTPIWDKSLAAFDRMMEDLTPEGRRLYQADLALMRQTTARYARIGMPVERVARAVVHALCARRPKTRYLVGTRTRLADLAARFLPDRLIDRGMRRTLRLR